MRKHVIGWVMLLICGLAIAACGSTTTRKGALTTLPPTHATTSSPLSPTPTLPPAGTISATISLIGSSQTYNIAASDTSVWIHNDDEGTIMHIDPKTNKVVATIPVGKGFGDIAFGQDGIWVASHYDGTIWHIDPQNNRVMATVRLTPPIAFLTVSPRGVWVMSATQDKLWHIDPQTNRVVATLSTVDYPQGISFGAGSVWICNHNVGTQGVTRLDPQTNRVLAQIDIGGSQGYECGALVALSNTIWVEIIDSNSNHGDLMERIDPATNKITAKYKLPDNLSFQFAADERGAWIFNQYGALYRIDPQTNKVMGELNLPGTSWMTLGAGSVWLCNSAADTVVRITPAT